MVPRCTPVYITNHALDALHQAVRAGRPTHRLVHRRQQRLDPSPRRIRQHHTMPHHPPIPTLRAKTWRQAIPRGRGVPGLGSAAVGVQNLPVDPAAGSGEERCDFGDVLRGTEALHRIQRGSSLGCCRRRCRTAERGALLRSRRHLRNGPAGQPIRVPFSIPSWTRSKRRTLTTSSRSTPAACASSIKGSNGAIVPPGRCTCAVPDNGRSLRRELSPRLLLCVEVAAPVGKPTCYRPLIPVTYESPQVYV